MSIPPPQSIRILIVDDHGIVRAGLRMLLESQLGITVVGEAATCAEALSLATRVQPDVIVLDLDLGGENAVESMSALLHATPEARILVLTGVRDPEAHRQAIRQGAMGLVLKEKAAETLLQAIAKVRAGEVWLEPTMIARVLGELTRHRHPHRPLPKPPRSPRSRSASARSSPLSVRDSGTSTSLYACILVRPPSAIISPPSLPS